jgi:hypothetical protein
VFLDNLQSDGSGAVIVASEDFVKKHKLEHQAVEIIGMKSVFHLDYD